MKTETLPTPATAARLAEGVAVHRGIRPAGKGVGRHTHDFHSITVLLSSPGSSLWCYGNGKCRSVRPAAGDVFFCPAHVTTAVRTEKAFESILLCLSRTIFSRVAGGATLGNAAPAIMRKDSFIERVVTSLANEVNREEMAGRELFASSLATALGIHLSREYANGSEDCRPWPGFRMKSWPGWISTSPAISTCPSRWKTWPPWSAGAGSVSPGCSRYPLG
jgi:hypothetical protein